MTLGFHIGFLEIGWVDILDILLVSVLLYQVYGLIRGSVAFKVFSGFLVLYLFYLIVRAAEMELLTNILGQFMGVGVLAVIILFQQEIRKFLLMVGKTPLFNDGSLWDNIKAMFRGNGAQRAEITSLLEAVKTLSGSNTGALIVLSRNTELKFYVESGDKIDALISKRLLMSIFNKYSPLHDGAVIIYHNRISAARCILPVTEREVSARFGLRHRAAIGMSEATDTLVIVVSEETGQISTMKNGVADHNVTPEELRLKIQEYLFEDGFIQSESTNREEPLTSKPEKAPKQVVENQ